MIRISQIKLNNDGNTIIGSDELRKVLIKKAARTLKVSASDIRDLRIIKHSIDARKKPQLFDIYVVDVLVGGKNEVKTVNALRDRNVQVVEEKSYDFYKNAEIDKSSFDDKKAAAKKIIVIGCGPAGLFCAYELAKHGFKPILLERGSDVDKRTAVVEEFWKGGKLLPDTNVQFGEGGAGTFSDGKLNTVVKDKALRGMEALDIFVQNGAPDKIKYESKPHVGTDILKNVVKSIRNKIIKLGGEVIFDTCVNELVINDKRELVAVKTARKDYECDMAVLAIGHSARDTFEMLHKNMVSMTPKPFAVGFRVEHPQKLINMSQYGMEDPKALPAAPYKLTTTTKSGRGVYSFCMCPGGYVVNASSEEKMLAVNGMSYSKRDSDNANSAIIITVSPEDYGNGEVLSGVEFQRKLERKAFELADGKIPVEYYGDFKASVNKESTLTGTESFIDKNTFTPKMKGEYSFSEVHDILPQDLNEAFVEGMESFGHMIRGYNDDCALVSGVESRTSSPVRIVRNEGGESENIGGLFPCGEGAGYAGGIMSAAMDGIRTAELVARKAYYND